MSNKFGAKHKNAARFYPAAFLCLKDYSNSFFISGSFWRSAVAFAVAHSDPSGALGLRLRGAHVLLVHFEL
jgi:hypothetical protein